MGTNGLNQQYFEGRQTTSEQPRKRFLYCIVSGQGNEFILMITKGEDAFNAHISVA